MSFWSTTPPPANCEHTIKSGPFGRQTKCVSESEWAFVGPVPYGFIGLFVIPWVLNIIFWLIAFCKNRKIHVPFWYLALSMLQNFGLALFVWGIMHVVIDGMAQFIPTIPFGLIILIFSTVLGLNISTTIPIDGDVSGLFLIRMLIFKKFCQCCNSFRFQMFPKFCIMKEGKVSKLRDRIAGNPPVLYIKVAKGLRNARIGFSVNEPLKYGSWEGNDDIVLDVDDGITIVKVKTELEISEEIHAYFSQAKHEYFKKLRAVNTALAKMHHRTAVYPYDPEVELGVDIYKVPKYFSICHKSAYVKFLNSGIGKFIYSFLMIFGYSQILDDIFIIMAKYDKIKTRRRIAPDGSLRIPAYKSNPQFTNEEFTATSLNYNMIPYQNEAYLQYYNAEMQKCEYNNQYFFTPSSAPMQGGYGYPPQQGAYPPPQGAYPPQAGYPNYQMPPQQGAYPPQPGYPTQQGYPNQQQYYGPPPIQQPLQPPPQQQEEKKEDV